MKPNSRETFSIGLLGLLLFIGCGADAPFTPPAAQKADTADPDPGGSSGTAGRGASGHAGTSSSVGSGGTSLNRDAGRGGSGARPTEAGGSGSGGTAGGAARDGGAGAGGRGGSGGGERDAASAARIVINEIVADPQQDWNDSADGATPFDATPGTGAVTGADEWIELYNGSGAEVDLSGWTLVMTDGTPATELLGTGDAILVFSRGGALTNYQAGKYVVIGNPKGDLNNSVTVELYDARGLLVDRVAIGGDGGPSGNATGRDDEAIARVPNAIDSDDDAADFSASPPTPGAAN